MTQIIEEGQAEELIADETNMTITRQFVARGFSSLTSVLNQLPVKRGDSHPENANVFVTDIDITRLTAQGHFTIDVTYAGPETSDPTNEPVRIRIGTRWVPLATSLDYEGNVIVNTAGDAVEFEHERPLRTFQLSRVFSTLPTWVSNATGLLNSDNVYIFGQRFDKHTLRMTETSAEDYYLGQNLFWRVHVGVEHDPQGYIKKTPNVGYNEVYYNGLGELKKIPITTEDGSPTTEKQFLNEDGEMFRDQRGVKRWDIRDDERLTIEARLDKAVPFRNFFYA